MEETACKAPQTHPLPPVGTPPHLAALTPEVWRTHRRARKAWPISPRHPAGLSLQGQRAAGSWVQFWAQEPCGGRGSPWRCPR